MNGKRTGRPLRIDDRIAAPTDDNQRRRIAVSEWICELMRRTGMRAEHAARSAGVGTRTVEMWLSNGAKAEDRAAKGEDLTANDGRLVEFLRDTRRAHQAWIDETLEHHRLIAEGGLTETRTFIEVDPNEIVERRDGTKGPKILKQRSQTVRLLPNASALEWRLERLARDEAGQRILAQRVEVTGADGEPVEVESREARADRIAAELRAFQMGADAAAKVRNGRNDSL